MRFQGQTIIVTGGATGLGRACALAFAAEGGAVVIADLAVEAGQLLAGEIGARGGKALFVRTDIGDARDAGCLVDATLEWACGVSVLVSGPEPAADAAALDLRGGDLDAVPRTSLQGAALVGQAVARAMAARGRGVIVNLSPALAGRGQVAGLATGGSIDQLTKDMAAGLADQGIRVIALEPGAGVAGPASSGSAEPAEIAQLVLFLASDASGAMTGQCVGIDRAKRMMGQALPGVG